MTPEEIKRAVRELPRDKDFVWDGVDNDERPASSEALAQARRSRGRPAGSGTKEQVALRLDRDLLDALRASGPGWQTRVNELLRKAVLASE